MRRRERGEAPYPEFENWRGKNLARACSEARDAIEFADEWLQSGDRSSAVAGEFHVLSLTTAFESFERAANEFLEWDGLIEWHQNEQQQE